MKYLLYYFIFGLIVLVFAYFNTMQSNKETKEGFTQKFRTKMNSTYRPILRNTRIGFKNLKNNAVKKIQNTIDSFI